MIRETFSEIVDGASQTRFQFDGGLPAELLPGQADVRPPLGRVVGRKRLEDD